MTSRRVYHDAISRVGGQLRVHFDGYLPRAYTLHARNGKMRCVIQTNGLMGSHDAAVAEARRIIRENPLYFPHRQKG